MWSVPKASRFDSIARPPADRGGTPAGLDRCRSHTPGHAQSFVDARLQIITDPQTPAGDRLRAMEQLESRALGKPKERVEQVNEEPEELRAMRSMTPEARRILLRQMNEAEAAAAAEAEDSQPPVG